MFKFLSIFIAALPFFFASASNATETVQSWNYQAYTASGSKANVGYFTVTEEDGNASFKMFASTLHNCLKANLKAHVERTDDTVIVTVSPRYHGCDEFRLVLKADGTGGKRQVRNGDEWVDDGLDRDLTIKK